MGKCWEGVHNLSYIYGETHNKEEAVIEKKQMKTTPSGPLVWPSVGYREGSSE